MNKELELEARKYAKLHPTKELDEEERYYNSDVKRYDSFIAGAKSKYVEKQKLEFAIEQLKRFRQATFGKGVNVIKELEQQLKEL